jgi:hypothetical protein
MKKILHLSPKQGAAFSGVAANSIDASNSGRALEEFIARAINTPNTNAYDKAIDSVYLAQGTGGSRLHHLLDGQHDLVGAFRAAQSAYPHDSLAAEVLGTAHHLAKDLFSNMGLPVVSLEPQSYSASSDWIADHLGISRLWQADLLQINGIELLGGGLAAVGVVLGIRAADIRILAEIAGGCGLASILAANPISMIAACVALGFAIKNLRSRGDTRKLLEHGTVGAASASAVYLAGNLLAGVAAAGALPALGAICLSIVSGITIRQWLRKKIVTPEGARNTTTSVPSLALQEPEIEAEKKWTLHLENMRHNFTQKYSPEALAIFRSAFT